MLRKITPSLLAVGLCLGALLIWNHQDKQVSHNDELELTATQVESTDTAPDSNGLKSMADLPAPHCCPK